MGSVTVLDSTGTTRTITYPDVGRAAAAASTPSVLSTEDKAALDQVNTNLTALNSLVSGTDSQLPATLGQKTASGSVSVVLASDQAAVPVSGALTDTQLRASAVPVSAAALTNLDADVGAQADAAATSDTGSFSLIAFIKRGLQNWTSLLAKIPALGQTTKSGSVPVTLASDQGNVPVSLTSTTITGSVAVTGPLTDTQLRASNVPTSLNALVYTVSTANSSTTQLAAGAPFTGTIESVQNAQAAQVSVVCDQAYTVQIKQFLDLAGTKALPIVTFTRAAGQALNENVSLFGDYFQVIVTNNGGSATTTFQVGVTFGLMNTQPASLTNDGKFPVEAGVPPLLATTYNVAGIIAINTVLMTLDCSQYRSASIHCTSMGTTGVVTPEWSNDNTTWVAATILTQAGASATTFNAAGLWVAPVMARYLRLRLSTATTAGTTTIVVHQTNDRAQFWLATQPISGTVSVTGYPTAAASADAFANPTVTKMDALASLFNGTTWDRSRNNAIVTMGDTGAKTATFNGATQTNYNATGAYITVAVGTVSGTSPTLAVQLQVSYDGTNFINLGPASSNITTSTQTCTFLVYPTNASQTAGATPANLTSGANQTIVINAPLPRTWRLVYTIGGTTPSFTLTNAYASYVL